MKLESDIPNEQGWSGLTGFPVEEEAVLALG